MASRRHSSNSVRSFAALLLLSTSAALRPSEGCKKETSSDESLTSLQSNEQLVEYLCPGAKHDSNNAMAQYSDVYSKSYLKRSCQPQLLRKSSIHVEDFEGVLRDYWVSLPPLADVPAPLLIAVHGQNGTAPEFAQSHNFSAVGRHENLITIYPQGMRDSDPDEDQGTGWNAGSGGDNTTCVPQGVGDQGGCYRSCRKLKQCGRCNWSTCYNDVLFIKTLINDLGKRFCLDLDRMYAHGESNGAMFVQHVVRELPGTFAGVDTWFGTPLVGYLLGKELNVVAKQDELSRTAYLVLHGRNDTCIPPEGGVDDGGWIYEPLEQSTGLWASLHRCDQRAAALATRWDGGPQNFVCKEWRHCLTGRRVVQCMYDGVHGDWPTADDGHYIGDEITLWFLFQFSRGDPAIRASDSTEFV